MAKNGTISGADPAFEKGEGAEGSGHAPRIFFCQFGGLFKEIGAKRSGRAPPAPPLCIRACISVLFIVYTF